MEHAQNTGILWSMEYLLTGCPFEFPLPSLRGASSHGPWNLAGKENSRCQKAVQLCSRLFPDIRSSLSFDHADPLPHLETILFRSLCINTGHHFPYRRILSFPEKILPGLPALRRQRPHHPCSQKKLRPVSSFFF